MAASKVILLVFCLLILIFSICNEAASPKTLTTKSKSTTTRKPVAKLGSVTLQPVTVNNKCECGIFKSVKQGKATPLFYQVALQNFDCDDRKCKEVCSSLSAFTEYRTAETICANFGYLQGLRPVIHYKSCTDKWIPSGTSQAKPICCAAGMVTGC